ncbi:hypothetical protein C5S53_01040 [Methanophagales archaeon]|nr:hypothetical protein C5S53_01040 [Methanophagales archaeon]
MKNTALIMTTVILALMSMMSVASAHDSIIINEIFNPAVNATDTNGNYNDTVNITLAVKETNGAVIPFPGRMPTIHLSNITFDAIISSPGNIEWHPHYVTFSGTGSLDRMDRGWWEFGVYDTQTNWSIDLHGDFDHVCEKVILKRLVTGKEGIEVANLAFFDLLNFDPMCVMLDFPLWIGKNWTSTTKITGRLVDETGTVIPIDTVAVVSGAVTDAIENNIRFEVAGQFVSCLIRYNIEISYPTGYISNNRDLHGIPLSNITFDIIPRPKNIEENFEKNQETVVYSPKVYGAWNGGKSLVSKAHAIYSWQGSHNGWVLQDSTIYSYTKMTGMLDIVSKEPKMERLVIELEPGAEVANLSFDPMFELFYFPLYVGKNWTATTNVTGILVNETGIVIPIDSFAVVAGAVIEEVEVIDEMDQTPTFGLVIENNISFEVEGALVSCLIKYWVGEPPTIFPRDLYDDFAEKREGAEGT